jgi:DNA-binding winged helix-turn-helix (wHTH) protein
MTLPRSGSDRDTGAWGGAAPAALRIGFWRFEMPIALPMSVSTGSITAAPHAFAFGEFVLTPERQSLMRLDRPVRIGGRALDLLTALVERPGELLDKQTLMARAWPTTFVESTNLKVNMASLRKALGERHVAPQFIATVVGRGYRFIAPVRATGSPAPASDGLPSGEVPSIVELIATIDAVRQQLAQISSSGG